VSAQNQGFDQICQANDELSESTALAPLVWRSEWESGHQEIDRQHQTLVDLGNELIPMLNSGESFEALTRQFEEIIEQLVRHFEYEETVLVEYKYPGADMHANIHKNLIGKAFQLKETVENRKIKPKAYVSFLVNDVIIDHMEVEDVLFFPYFKNQPDPAGIWKSGDMK
jgi:hemerythrin-like metal-binding protein